MKFSAEAPSNIALIKYMGKIADESGKNESQKNRPTNSSISLTLPEFRSRVEVAPSTAKHDSVVGFAEGQWIDPELSPKGRKKFLDFFEVLKKEWQVSGHFDLRSANNFPGDCGVASSASSFAALTLAAYEVAKSQHKNLDLTAGDLAMISRRGSGSSCRSFGGDFVLWKEHGVENQSFETEFHHELILVDGGKKTVSSSEAHAQVAFSSMFVGRPERAEKRMNELLTSLQSADWSTAWQITWDEFWDMHNLFHTCKPPFQYMTPKTLTVLETIRNVYQDQGDGPMVTMDAGANVHLLYRADQESIWPQLNSEVTGLKLLVGRRIEV